MIVTVAIIIHFSFYNEYKSEEQYNNTMMCYGTIFMGWWFIAIIGAHVLYIVAVTALGKFLLITSKKMLTSGHQGVQGVRNG